MIKTTDKRQARSSILRQAGHRSAQVPAETFEPKLTPERLIPALTNFIAGYPELSRSLFNLHGQVHPLGSRLGRGEVLVYFLFDDVELGGSSSSIDVLIDGEPTLEIKCASRVGERYHSFFLGIDEVPASFRLCYRVLELFEKNDRLGKLLLPANFANISKSKLEELQAVSATAYQRAVDAYFNELFKSKAVEKTYLFFDKETGLPIYHGRLHREQLRLERISGGLTRLSFKP